MNTNMRKEQFSPPLQPASPASLLRTRHLPESVAPSCTARLRMPGQQGMQTTKRSVRSLVRGASCASRVPSHGAEAPRPSRTSSKYHSRYREIYCFPSVSAVSVRGVSQCSHLGGRGRGRSRRRSAASEGPGRPGGGDCLRACESAGPRGRVLSSTVTVRLAINTGRICQDLGAGRRPTTAATGGRPSGDFIIGGLGDNSDGACRCTTDWKLGRYWADSLSV